MRLQSQETVMRGLEPRIHPLPKTSFAMNRRVKPGGDA